VARSPVRTPLVALSAAICALAFAVPASALPPRPASAIPDGASLVELLGSHALAAFAPPNASAMGALVRLPAGAAATDFGLRPIAPGIGRLRGAPGAIVAFAQEHPDLAIEVAPPLHPLLDTASVYVGSKTAIANGFDGTGAIVGIADTGVDVTHPDFLDAQGNTRIAWLLDLSQPPIGKHPDLEAQFGMTDASGTNVLGAVWSADDINAVLHQTSTMTAPQDEEGHGTLVASCAAGNGSSGQTPYRGVAPGATLVVARVASAGTDAIDLDGILVGVSFLYNRADALGMPIVVNLSIGSDYGPHDGSLAWEQALASNVGPSQPGHALVVAAGNSGSIAPSDVPIHESVHVSSGATMRVPILTNGAQNGGAEVWVAMHPGANIEVGLDGPDGTWIAPVSSGGSAGKTTDQYAAGIFNGSQAANSPVPPSSIGAVVEWEGAWPSGTYFITLEGDGTADLYVEGDGDASIPGVANVQFAYGVREGTVSLPATHPAIIGVGCTINKGSWRSIDKQHYGLSVPNVDAVGGMPVDSERDASPGEPCWFSSAGPTLTGYQKPEIMAPGAAIIGALSQQAVPPAPASIFTGDCPTGTGGIDDPTCEQIDTNHAVSAGTSFSSPLVAGAVAVLFQQDPTLTQEDVLAALQGGVHRLRGPAPFDDQAGTGELDVPGAIAALQARKAPVPHEPVRSHSWMTLGADVFLADGSTPLQAVVLLRSSDGDADAGAIVPADDFGDARVGAYVLVDGSAVAGAVQSLEKRGPGVWVATIALPAGLGGSSLTAGATLDGVDIVDPKTIPIATDVWNAEYPPSLKGGCSATRGPAPRVPYAALAAVGLFALRRRRRSTRVAAAPSRGSWWRARVTSLRIDRARA
jgi:MYXO-CTERM domain-containing protein